MTRFLTVGAAQMGPIQRSHTRRDVVERLIAHLREAKRMGCELVVFPIPEPRPRPSSGSFFAPNTRSNTIKRMPRCHGESPPTRASFEAHLTAGRPTQGSIHLWPRMQGFREGSTRSRLDGEVLSRRLVRFSRQAPDGRYALVLSRQRLPSGVSLPVFVRPGAECFTPPPRR